jgi:adenosylmethionine-8-amino-7-oxononanoate aminotransferase
MPTNEVVLEELDKRSHMHPFTLVADHLETGPKVMVEGRGLVVKDNHGHEYIDSMAGLWCVNVGWGREELVAAMSENGPALYGPGLDYASSASDHGVVLLSTAGHHRV